MTRNEHGAPYRRHGRMADTGAFDRKASRRSALHGRRRVRSSPRSGNSPRTPSFASSWSRRSRSQVTTARLRNSWSVTPTWRGSEVLRAAPGGALRGRAGLVNAVRATARIVAEEASRRCGDRRSLEGRRRGSAGLPAELELHPRTRVRSLVREPLVDKYSPGMDQRHAILPGIQAEMKGKLWQRPTVLRESLVRAASGEIRARAWRRAECPGRVQEERGRAFFWTGELFDLLGEYSRDPASVTPRSTRSCRSGGVLRRAAAGWRT